MGRCRSCPWRIAPSVYHVRPAQSGSLAGPPGTCQPWCQAALASRLRGADAAGTRRRSHGALRGALACDLGYVTGVDSGSWFLLGAPWDCSGTGRGEAAAPGALRTSGLARLVDVDLGDAATLID